VTPSSISIKNIHQTILISYARAQHPKTSTNFHPPVKTGGIEIGRDINSLELRLCGEVDVEKETVWIWRPQQQKSIFSKFFLSLSV
jgi:hypothetical protein